MTPTGLRRKDVEAAGRKVVRLNGKQILLLINGGRLFAIANRCPHEGYPLSEGTDGPGVLTCNWHNWKFALETGDALIGRDPVRTYRLEEQDGQIFIDLSDPPPEQLCAHALKGLDAALADNDLARIAREVARLERAGFPVKAALAHAFKSRSDRLEDGMGHAHAAAADWLALADRAPNDAARLAASLEPLAAATMKSWIALPTGAANERAVFAESTLVSTIDEAAELASSSTPYQAPAVRLELVIVMGFAVVPTEARVPETRSSA